MILAALILFTVFTTGVLYKHKIIHPVVKRKIIYLVIAFAAGICVYLVNNSEILVVTGIVISILAFILSKKNVIKPIYLDQKTSRGIFFLSLSFTLLILLFEIEYKWAVFFSMLILAVPGSAAAIAGTLFSKKYYNITTGGKSIIGNTVFIITTVAIFILFSHRFLFNLETSNLSISPLLYFILSVSIISLILTTVEAVSSDGFGNFTIPVFTTVLMIILFDNPQTELLTGFITGLVLALIVSSLSYKFDLLTISGSTAAFLLAGFIFGLGGLKWSIPIITFFILSSILSKVREKVNQEVNLYFEKSATRDYMQVISNGGLGGVLVVANKFYPSELFYSIYVASLAAVCADTWATEIGTLKKTKTYNILNLKPAEQGISGGISAIGSLGAFLGAVAIAVSALFWINDILYFSLLIIFAGVAGSFIDSILGASIQAQNKCPVCKKITEKETHCGKSTEHFKGIKWFNNDLVNLFSGISGGIIILIVNGF